jgi:hypothetical protein
MYCYYIQNRLRIETVLRLSSDYLTTLWRTGRGGMSMSSVSEFSRSRPGTESPNKPRFRTAVRNVITRARLGFGKLVSFAFARVLLIFLLGFAAGIAWQSYGGGARKAIAGWSPRLAWVAPTSASSSGSTERLKATSLALASVRQSVDKLASEIGKLQPEDTAPQRRRR